MIIKSHTLEWCFHGKDGQRTNKQKILVKKKWNQILLYKILVLSPSIIWERCQTEMEIF